MISFEEYKAKTKERFWDEEWPFLTEKEVDDFLNSPEIATIIKEHYEMDLIRCQRSKCPEKALEIGSVGGLVMCLGLMY